MSGFPQVYGKDGIFLVWQLMHPAVIVYNAESVEVRAGIFSNYVD